MQRLALYAQDSWRVKPHLTFNYGLRYQTTYGLFTASGRSQLENPAYLTLQALGISLVSGVPQDDRKQFAPRLGIAYSPGQSGKTVIRAGFGMFYNDLAQGGWAEAFQAVNNSSAGFCCLAPGDPGALIDPNYKTPYAIHATAGVQHAINSNWTVSADYTHEQGNHRIGGTITRPASTLLRMRRRLACFTRTIDRVLIHWRWCCRAMCRAAST